MSKFGTSRQYAARRQAETEAAIAAGKDPDDFKRTDDGELLYGIYVEGIATVPESQVKWFVDFLRGIDLTVENEGRINPSGIPENLD